MAETEIYLDNAATTQVCPQVADAVVDAMLRGYGNPSSLHQKGLEAKLALEGAARTIGETLGVSGESIVFTSGGTEADNLAILGGALAKRRKGNKIVTTSIEHAAVLASVAHLETMGFVVTYIPPNTFGEIDAAAVVDAVDANTVLVCVMAINNEVGSVLPVGEIARGVRRKNPETLIHCDAVQAYGKTPLRIGSKFDVDLLSVSGHKIHAPKGVGALYIKKGVRILPQTYGGSQQKGLRVGTENLPLAVGFAVAAQLVHRDCAAQIREIEIMKEHFMNNLYQMGNVCINSPMNGTPYIMNISIKGYRSEIMLHYLESKGIYLSSGSACAKGHKSHVLTAMQMHPHLLDSALRISFGKDTTLAQIDTLTQALQAATVELCPTHTTTKKR